MGRSPSSEKLNNGVKKGPWTAEEDQKLTDYIHKHGHGRWRILPKNAGLKRCGKSCRLRWTNYLRPDIKRGKFSLEEEDAIIQLHKLVGNKWSSIASRLPGRTDNEIKNYWNTQIKKKLLRMGIDPVTHSHNPRLDLLELSSIINSATQLSSLRLLNPDLFNLASTLLSCQQNATPQFGVPNYQQQNLEQFSSDPNNSSWENILINSCQETRNVYRQPSFSCSLPKEQEMITESQLFCNTGNMGGFGSVRPTPPPSSSTPLNSTSTSCGNGGTEDERDSYCSNLFFDSLDAILFDSCNTL